MLHIVLVWQRQPRIKSERMITRFCSKNGANPLNSLFTLGAEHSKTLSDTKHIFFGVGAFQVIMVTKIVPDHLNQV